MILVGQWVVGRFMAQIECVIAYQPGLFWAKSIKPIWNFIVSTYRSQKIVKVKYGKAWRESGHVTWLSRFSDITINYGESATL